MRFEVSSRAFAPDLEVVAPVRTWGFSRDDSIEYAKRSESRSAPPRPALLGRPKPLGPDSRMRILEAPGSCRQPTFTSSAVPKAAGGEPAEVVLSFDEPVCPWPLTARRDPGAGRAGAGRKDRALRMRPDRHGREPRVGIGSREIYECPGALALLIAHADLEGMTLERDLAHEKSRLEPRWAELVYDGLWFSPLKASLDAFFMESQRFVTGEVRLRCEPGTAPQSVGSCFVAGRRSPVALYDHDLATYSATDRFRHQDALALWGSSASA